MKQTVILLLTAWLAWAHASGGNETGRKVKWVGTIQAQQGNLWVIDNQRVEIGAASRIDSPLRPGDRVRIKGYAREGRVIAVEIKRQ